jgi:hypothetical protein
VVIFNVLSLDMKNLVLIV